MISIKGARMSEKIEFQLGLGLDVGTAFISSSRLSKDGKYVEKTVRDAYFQIPDAGPFTKNLVKKAGVSTIEIDKKLYVLGSDALRAAAEWAGTLHRPMSNGVISSKERKFHGREVFFELLKEAVGAPVVKDENCVYSVPAKPLNADFDIAYHEDVIGGFLLSSGFKPSPMNEALAVIYACLADANFTGIGISLGAGMVNIAAARSSAEILSFSVVGSGDWIDERVAQSTGISISKATLAKEAGVDLVKPKNDIEQAIATYYRRLIKNVMENFSIQFVESPKAPEFTQAIDIAISGGTSKAINFDKMFSDALTELNLPFKVGKIIMGDPDFSVARGCLMAAQAT